jgi:hypothetical protein
MFKAHKDIKGKSFIHFSGVDLREKGRFIGIPCLPGEVIGSFVPVLFPMI